MSSFTEATPYDELEMPDLSPFTGDYKPIVKDAASSFAEERAKMSPPPMGGYNDVSFEAGSPANLQELQQAFARNNARNIYAWKSAVNQYNTAISSVNKSNEDSAENNRVLAGESPMSGNAAQMNPGQFIMPTGEPMAPEGTYKPPEFKTPNVKEETMPKPIYDKYHIRDMGQPFPKEKKEHVKVEEEPASYTYSFLDPTSKKRITKKENVAGKGATGNVIAFISQRWGQAMDAGLRPEDDINDTYQNNFSGKFIDNYDNPRIKHDYTIRPMGGKAITTHASITDAIMEAVEGVGNASDYHMPKSYITDNTGKYNESQFKHEFDLLQGVALRVVTDNWKKLSGSLLPKILANSPTEIKQRFIASVLADKIMSNKLTD
jgi:hypothetical protein